MQLHELEQLQALLHATVGPQGPLDIPHDALARFTSGQDVLYKCDAPWCPGYAWPAKLRPHPCKGNSPAAAEASEPSSPAPATKSSSAKLVPGCRSTHPDYCLRIYGACEFSADPCPGAEPSSPAPAEASEPSSPVGEVGNV